MSEYRQITGQYRRYYTDEAMPSAVINFKLLNNSFTLAATYPTSAVAGTDAGQNVQTDDQGNLPSSLVLFASGLSIGETRKYKVTDPDGFAWEFVLPAGNTPVSLQELRANGLTNVAQDTVLALIGNTDLEDLRDVDFTGLTNGDAVIWDETLGLFVNRQVSGGPGGVAGVSSVNGRAGAVTLAKADVGLNNVNNTADANKPISNSTQAALDGKQPSLGFTPVRSAVGSPRTTTAIWCGTTAQLALINPRDLNTLYVEI